MATTIYNGLLYTTKEINRNFRIKINGIVDGKKVNKLVGVKGLIELIGVEMANKMLRRAFNGTDDKTVCKLRRGIKISFYVNNIRLDYIRHVIKPKPKECYRNSHLLCEAFPERILYCEGKTNVPIPIDHAFNKVGDAYIDITFEFALHENPSIYEYVTFGEYDAKTISKAVLETGYYGGIYKWLYYQSKK